MAITVLVSLVVSVALTVGAVDTKNRFLVALGDFPTGHIPYLQALHEAVDLQWTSEIQAAYLGEPIAFLSGVGLSLVETEVPAPDPFELVEDLYQVTALDVSEKDLSPEEAWFHETVVAEGFGPSQEAIAYLFDRVGAILQSALPLPAEDGADGWRAPRREIAGFVELLSDTEENTLADIRKVLLELNDAELDSARRTAFIDDPRAYLLDQGIFLSPDKYRIVAIDFERAARLEGVTVVAQSPIPTGAVSVPASFGFVGENIITIFSQVY
jgi:hypothetical protein